MAKGQLLWPGDLDTLPRAEPPLHLSAAELLESRACVSVLASCPQRKWPPVVAHCGSAAAGGDCLGDSPHGLCRSWCFGSG